MEKQIIIQIKDKRATLLSENAEIVCGNSDYTAKFEFADEDFLAYGAKTALFVYGKNATPIVFEGDTCPIPPLADCSFCLIGVIAGDVKTTTGAKVPCVASISDMGDTPLPPTEDVYNQIMEIIGKLDPENALDEEKIKELIKEVIESEGIGSGLTEEDVKEIVATETEGKLDKYYGSSNNLGGNGFLYAVDAQGNQIIEQYNHQLYASSSGTIVKRFGMHILVPEQPETLNIPNLVSKVATSKYYVDKGDTENADKIAKNTKRIENLESTLLTYIEDTASAYEKAVPVGVAPNAILDMIGGATYTSKNAFNPALLNSSNYEITADGGIRYLKEVTFIPTEASVYLTLSAGTWYFSVSGEGNIPAGFEVYSNGTIISTGNPFTLETRQEIEFRWYYEVEGIWEKPFYIMLSQTEGAPFEPYFEGERYAPVTAIKSYGANLFNPKWLVDYVSSEYAGKIEYSDGVLKVNDYPVITSITFAKFLELTGLKVGDTFSSKHIVYDENGAIMPGGTYNITFENGGDGTWLDIINQGGKTITITEDMLKWKNLKIYMSNASTSPKYVKNIMLVKGGSQAEYHPYSAEPIDTYTMPSEIQALDGYGKEGFVLDFDSKTATYQGKTTDISAYLTDYATFKSLSVQGGGKLIFENTYKYALPSILTYVKRKE